jgi:tRNA(fMet)-specific endonuclease VapC
MITLAELEVGICRSSRPAFHRGQLSEFLSHFRILDFTLECVGHYGEIRVALERQGRRIGPLDLLIAAHARSLGAAVITGNVAEFQRVPGLKVIAWQ